MAYIDTSVLVACYCPEPLSAAAQKALGGPGRPSISRLVEIEFHAAVAVKVRARELDPATANRLLLFFRTHLDDGRYAVAPVGNREYDLARGWIGQFSAPLRAPDALHLAAALNNDLTLVTADRDLARAASCFGVKHDLVS